MASAIGVGVRFYVGEYIIVTVLVSIAFILGMKAGIDYRTKD